MLIESRQKARWLYELRLNGFIIFRNFLPLDLIQAMSDQFRPILNGELARLQAGDTSKLRGRNRLSVCPGRFIRSTSMDLGREK